MLFHFAKSRPLSSRTRAARILVTTLVVLAFTVDVLAVRIVLTNDDGFESANIQALFTALKAGGHDVILSAPYLDQSGSSGQVGSLSEIVPTTIPSPGGRIAAGAPGAGLTTFAADQYYVNHWPATAVLYGIDVQAMAKWGALPDLVIAGPNNGNNLGGFTLRSGTLGAAVTALNRGIPAIAVSGANGDASMAPLLAQITARIVAAVIQQGRVMLAANTGLNVNVPQLDPGRTAESYRVVFTQMSAESAVTYPPVAMNPLRNEMAAFLEGGTVTVSAIEGTFQASADASASVWKQMRPIFSTAPTVVNPKMINISARGFVGPREAAQIIGFYVFGSTPKTMLIRASGPALAQFGVVFPLSDPVLEVFDHDNRSLALNDNWSDDPAQTQAIASVAARVGAFGWSEGSRDAALLLTLAPGSYTAVIRSGGLTSGVALAEVYDASVD